MVYTLSQKRNSNVEIIRSITNERNKIYFKINYTTNTEKILAFFSHLINKLYLKTK